MRHRTGKWNRSRRLQAKADYIAARRSLAIATAQREAERKSAAAEREARGHFRRSQGRGHTRHAVDQGSDSAAGVSAEDDVTDTAHVRHSLLLHATEAGDVHAQSTEAGQPEPHDSTQYRAFHPEGTTSAAVRRPIGVTAAPVEGPAHHEGGLLSPRAAMLATVCITLLCAMIILRPGPLGPTSATPRLSRSAGDAPPQSPTAQVSQESQNDDDYTHLGLHRYRKPSGPAVPTADDSLTPDLRTFARRESQWSPHDAQWALIDANPLTMAIPHRLESVILVCAWQ